MQKPSQPPTCEAGEVKFSAVAAGERAATATGTKKLQLAAFIEHGGLILKPVRLRPNTKVHIPSGGVLQSTGIVSGQASNVYPRDILPQGLKITKVTVNSSEAEQHVVLNVQDVGKREINLTSDTVLAELEASQYVEALLGPSLECEVKLLAVLVRVYLTVVHK
jgi:hypothetical protein